MLRSLVLALACLACLLAPGAAAALTEADPSPRLELRLGAGMAGATTAPEVAGEPAPVLNSGHLLAAGGATALAVPTGLLVGTLWAGVPSNLLLAALPSLLVFGALPPVAVTTALWVVSRRDGIERRWWPVALAATGAHLAVTTAGILLGASTRNPGAAVAFALTDIAAVTGAALLAYRFTY